MDQVKAVVRAMLKHGFWIACGLIVLISVGTWYTASSGLRSEFAANKTKIDGAFSSAETLQNKANPPNDHSKAQMQKLNAKTYDLVLQAWQRQFSEQEKILVWNRRLGADFVNAVRPLKPIEVKVAFPTPQRQKLNVDFRQRYSNYVANLLPALAERVGAIWQVQSRLSDPAAEGTTPAGPVANPATDPRFMPPGSQPPQEEPLVVWSASDQGALVARHFDWSGQPDAAPTTLQVLYAQEDLWVLRALVEIVAQTNKDAESRHDAIVKTIQTILIGSQAGARAGQIYRASGGTSSAYGGYGEEEYGEEASMDEESYSEEEYTEEYSEDAYSEEGGEYGDVYAGGAGGPVSSDPAEGRYVNNEYERLRAADLRTALETGGPENAFLVVAKRMPIRMELVVDGRKLHRLLAECGNSALPVEIRQVRINRSSGATGTSGGGYGEESMGGYGEESMGGFGGTGGFGGMGGMGGYGEESYGEESYGEESYGEESYGGYGEDSYGEESYGEEGYGSADSGRSEVSSSSPYDVKVELFGIIYIYNPVDKEKLGGGAEFGNDSGAVEATPEDAPLDAAAAMPDEGDSNS